jgi:hypothetical protein
MVAGSRITRLPSRYERDMLFLQSPANCFVKELNSSPATSKFPFRGGFFPCCVLIGYSPGVNGWNGGCCPHLNWLMKPVSLLKALQFKWLLKRRNRTYLMSGYEPPPDLTCRQLLNCVGFDNTQRFISTN